MKRILASIAVATLSVPSVASAQAEPFLGQMMTVGYNFCPVGWSTASGQLLPIAQYSALFSLLGTQFGGDGRTTFALPDLRGRAVVGTGQGPGLSAVSVGEKSGAETVTLNQTQLPSHNHAATSSLFATEEDATTVEPGGALLGIAGQNIYASGAADSQMAAGAVTTTVGSAGGNQPVNIRDPYLGMTVCIALQGIYPSRS